MRMSQAADVWWKTAVVYCADVQTFLDSDGDGHGDLAGMASRIDYLADLGITCLWLMPFYPSAGRDDGYDITDFYGVDGRYGSHGDFVELVRTAHNRGIRVIVDFVMNHTSEKHPWFRSARSSKSSRFRDYYVWRDTTPPDTSSQVVFPGEEDSIWQFDERTGEYYLHHFYKSQPDLNIGNPEVRDEIAKTMGFWLELGLSGFRVDAVPFMFTPDKLPDAEHEFAFDPHMYLRHLRSYLSRRVGDGILLGEVNVPHEEQAKFFGGEQGGELTMQFDFIGMQAFYLAMARQDATPLVEALHARPKVDPDSQWATFLRNHDELTLDKLSDEERAEVFAAFGPEPEMQLYGRGLRRRLPPMLGGDQRRIRMAYSLLFSTPGTPVLFYGEEIGMGDNPDLPERLAVRTPMQWTPDANGGFSTAPPRKLARPLPEGAYAARYVNVADQRNDPDSLLSFMRQLIHRYRQSPELGWSEFHPLEQPHAAVLAHLCRTDEWAMVAVHNLGSEPCTVPLDLSWTEPGTVLVDLLQEGRTELEDGQVEVKLEGYGYRWLRVSAPGDRRIA
jgi:trehalose synthase